MDRGDYVLSLVKFTGLRFSHVGELFAMDNYEFTTHHVERFWYDKVIEIYNLKAPVKVGIIGTIDCYGDYQHDDMRSDILEVGIPCDIIQEVCKQAKELYGTPYKFQQIMEDPDYEDIQDCMIGDNLYDIRMFHYYIHLNEAITELERLSASGDGRIAFITDTKVRGRFDI